MLSLSKYEDRGDESHSRVIEHYLSAPVSAGQPGLRRPAT